MDVISLPFNAHVGLARSETKGCLLELAPRAEHLNHLGTVHASALYALAEATSGEFLVQARGDREAIGGVVRRAEWFWRDRRPLRHFGGFYVLECERV